MNHNLNIGLLVSLIIAIMVSSVLVLVSFTNSPSSTEIPFESKVTPFNITTTLSWDPFSFSGSVDFKMSNTTISGSEGAEIPFYDTQLPLFQFYNNVSYSIQILKFQGPSNISIILSGSQFIYSSFNGRTGTSSGPDQVILNPFNNNSFSGSLHIQQMTFYHGNKNLFPNTTSWFEYEYNLFYIQPKPVNYPIWNHYLTLRISLSGFEDRPLFNYFRKIHGYPVWSSNDFRPYNMDHFNNTLVKKSFSFTPINNIDGFSYPSWLIYADNQSFLTKDFLHLKIHLQTNHPLNLKIYFARELAVTYDGYIACDFTVSRSIGHSPLYNDSSVDVLLNWQETNYINGSIRSIKLNKSNNMLSIYTSPPYLYYDNPLTKQITGVNQTLANYTFNFVSVSLENPDNISQWDASGIITTDISWGPTNTSLAPATSLMYGNNGKKSIHIRFDLGPIRRSNNQTPFSTDFFILAIIFLNGKNRVMKRSKHLKYDS